MLPTRLNVLPPDKQKTLQRMIRNEFIRCMLAVTIIVSAIIGMALIGGRIVLEGYFGDLADTINAVNIDTKDQNSNIEQSNTRIAIASRVLSDFHYWPDTLVTLTESVPEGIVLSRLTIDGAADTATLTGTADTRQQLLAFGESLRTIPWIDRVDIPISQLTTQENITFTIRTTLTLSL